MVIAMLTYEKICVAYKFLKLFYLEEVIALILHIYFFLLLCGQIIKLYILFVVVSNASLSEGGPDLQFVYN